MKGEQLKLKGAVTHFGVSALETVLNQDAHSYSVSWLKFPVYNSTPTWRKLMIFHSLEIKYIFLKQAVWDLK